MCGFVFESGRRKQNNLKRLWHEYADGKQTYNQLASKYGQSKRGIQKQIDRYEAEVIHAILSSDDDNMVVIGMDASYWGRNFGVMVFRDLYRKRNLFWMYVKNETVTDYLNGMELLTQKGWNISGVVCDGKSGLLNAIKTIPVQLCQYHQYKTVIRYITKNPKLIAGIELKSIADLMQKTDKESFIGALHDWYIKWKFFLQEKSFTSEKKRNWRYTHNRIRSAYNSLNRYKNYLFTWYDYPELKIPQTNNSLEGVFSNLKIKTANHNGLKRNRKIKLINHLLKN